MSSDLTFITNEEEQSLVNRFTALIKDTRFFDCLRGYFYTSGFYTLHKSLEKTEKIRILIGISTNKETFDLIQESRKEVQKTLHFSHKETKEEFLNQVVKELDNSSDSIDVEAGIRKFIEWLNEINPLKILAKIRSGIYPNIFQGTFARSAADVSRPNEVILSEYLVKGG